MTFSSTQLTSIKNLIDFKTDPIMTGKDSTDFESVPVDFESVPVDFEFWWDGKGFWSLFLFGNCYF